jgi:hypothetical protein
MSNLKHIVRPQWTYKLKRTSQGVRLYKTCVMLSLCFQYPLPQPDPRTESEVYRHISTQMTLGL